MAEKAHLNPESQKFDWRKSPAHLTFLATFIQPRAPDKHPTDTPWPLVLGEPPEKAVERFQKEGVLIPCTTSQILAHELPRLTIKKLQELSRELDLQKPKSRNREVLVQQLVQTRHPGLLLSVPERSLVQCSDEGQRLVELFLARGGEILEGTDEPTAQAVKNVLIWLIKNGIVLGVAGNAAWDLLKQWLSPKELEELPPPPKIPLTETPSPKPPPTPPQETTPPPKETPSPQPVRRRQPFEPEMIHIPAGHFWMGADEFDSDAREWEKPRHQVYLSEYWIGKYPITNREYQFFVRETGHHSPYSWKDDWYPEGKGNHPVVSVSWSDADAYCRWLAGKTGRPYRLPTEAEWEKAARGTDGRIYPWGNKWDKNRCNSRESGIRDTTPVGQYSPAGDSPYGCADMAGNVWEWCADWFGEKEYERRKGKTMKDPQGPETGMLRVRRGGAFYIESGYARCAARFRFGPYFRYHDRGFRVGVVGRPYPVSGS